MRACLLFRASATGDMYSCSSRCMSHHNPQQQNTTTGQTLSFSTVSCKVLAMCCTPDQKAIGMYKSARSWHAPPAVCWLIHTHPTTSSQQHRLLTTAAGVHFHSSPRARSRLSNVRSRRFSLAAASLCWCAAQRRSHHLTHNVRDAGTSTLRCEDRSSCYTQHTFHGSAVASEQPNLGQLCLRVSASPVQQTT